MTTVLSIVGALLLLTILIIIHEAGHFFVGKKLGFTILEFSVGMGPVLLKKERDGIDYSIRAFPIGGMCRFYGEDQEVKDGRCFNAHPVWQRMLVILAGPVMNLLFAVLFAFITFCGYGNYAPYIVSVNPDSPAYTAGLEADDVLLSVGKERIDFYMDAFTAIKSAPSNGAVFVVERNGERLSFVVDGMYNAASGGNVLGVTVGVIHREVNVLSAMALGVRYIGSIARQTFSFLGTLFRGQADVAQLTGVVGIVDVAGQAIRSSLESVLSLTVVISMSLGLMNLLPIPALDGGRFIFLLIEAIRHKPIDQRVEGAIHFVGLVLLMVLMAFLVYKDVANLITTGSVIG